MYLAARCARTCVGQLRVLALVEAPADIADEPWLEADADEPAHALQRPVAILVHILVEECERLIRREDRAHVVERRLVVAELPEARLLQDGDELGGPRRSRIDALGARMVQRLAPGALDRIAHDEEDAGCRRQTPDVLEPFPADDGVLGRDLAGEPAPLAMAEEIGIPLVVDRRPHVVPIPAPVLAIAAEAAPFRPQALMVLAVARAPLRHGEVLRDATHMVEVVDLLHRCQEQLGMVGEDARQPRGAGFLRADADKVVVDPRCGHVERAPSPTLHSALAMRAFPLRQCATLAWRAADH